MSTTGATKGTIDVTKCLDDITSSNLTFSKEALQLVVDAGDAITPFMPLIGSAATIISGIVNIYQSAQYNKKICGSLLDRARLAEIAIDQLLRRKQENEKNFKNESWYNAFCKFVSALDKMRLYAEKVTQLQGISNFFKTKSISERFKELTVEYDTVMKDLNFTMAIANEQQRQIDQENIEKDLTTTNQFLEKIDKDMEKQDVELALIREELKILILKLERSGDAEVQKIEQSQLTEPENRRKTDSRGSRAPYVTRKIYMNSIEVACKPIKIDKNDKEYKRIQRHFAILLKSSQSPNIIRFYGLSTVDDNTIMALEWAEHGDLRNYYVSNSNKIPLGQKLNFALHICRAIAYLNALDIYHHDVRCRNVMVTKDYVAKLSNFELSRAKGTTSLNLVDRIDIGRWTAPEKLKNDKYDYNQKCEIFSFGMLLWELTFEKKPYEGKDIEKISDQVISGKREKIKFDSRHHLLPLSSEFKDIQKDTQIGLENIIKGAWEQDHNARTDISKLLIDIDNLASSCSKYSSPPSLHSQVVINKDNEIPEEYHNDDVDFNLYDFEPMIPIGEGIKAHKSRDHEKAWKCFDMQAENQNNLGKYWKAFYLWEGFSGQKDKITALTLYKEAADEGVVDAQFRYACALLDKDLKLKYKVNPKDAVKYLKMAADNGSGTAQFQMGEAYLRGKLFCPEDHEIAKLWYKRAALNDEKKAKDRLNELELK